MILHCLYNAYRGCKSSIFGYPSSIANNTTYCNMKYIPHTHENVCSLLLGNNVKFDGIRMWPNEMVANQVKCVCSTIIDLNHLQFIRRG